MKKQRVHRLHRFGRSHPCLFRSMSTQAIVATMSQYEKWQQRQAGFAAQRASNTATEMHREKMQAVRMFRNNGERPPSL